MGVVMYHIPNIHEEFEEFQWDGIGHVADALAHLWDKADNVKRRTKELLDRYRTGDESDQLFEEMKKLYDKLEP